MKSVCTATEKKTSANETNAENFMLEAMGLTTHKAARTNSEPLNWRLISEQLTNVQFKHKTTTTNTIAKEPYILPKQQSTAIREVISHSNNN